MVAYTILKRHHTGIANIEISRDPHAVYWLGSTEESRPWACACVLDDGLSQVEPVFVAKLSSQWSVGNVLVVVHEEDDSVT